MEYASTERQQFAILNGWRGICATVVALHHLNFYGHFYDVPLVVNAWLFVDFFFVLSGFIISYAYADRLGCWRSTLRFVVRRFGRLWPLHMAVLAPLVGLELLKLILSHHSGMVLDRPAFTTENNTLASVFTNIALVQSLGVHDVLTWNRPSWSISTEFYTYIVFALFLIVTRRALPRLVLPFLIAAGGGAVVFLFSNTGMNTTWDFGFFRCLYGFFIGHLTYRLWHSGAAAPLLDRHGLWEPLALYVALVFVWAAGETTWSLAAPFVFAFVVLVFAYERGPVSRLMNIRPIALLGVWSYSIYMVNWPLVDFLGRGFKFSERFTNLPTMIEKAFPWEDNPVQLVFIGNRWVMDGLALAYLLLVIGIAAVTYGLIEQPARQLFNRLAMRSRKPDAAKPTDLSAEGQHARPKVAGA